AGTETPLICDADTGFGGLLNIRHTVRGFEAAGCAAIQLEDQESPKRCGLTRGIRVVAVDEMVRRIEVALEARADRHLLLVARTDARAALGLNAAIERGARYAQAGADVVFVQGIETEEELRRVTAGIECPCIVNIAAPGALGSLASSRLRALGCRIAIYPGLAMLAATAAMSAVYETLRRDGSLVSLEQGLYDREAMHRLMGFEDVWAFEARWRDPG
ncbi:MAG TPA: isocitrate lyase/phosphoenolpyruvate mutase family protein, partial [Gammaproteobacteria bacterium]|nr:isocitrate lyase/phosphoenolpyruvate mutase family protein [Gammaproteobacteria bacterium]